MKKQDVFFELLARMAQNLERSGVCLSGVFRGEERSDALQGLQAAQRDYQARLLDALAATIVTPLDGQDLFNLSQGLGRLLNDVLDVAVRLDLSGCRLGPNLVQLASCAEESLRETSRSLACLVRRDRFRVAAATGRLCQLEDRAGQIFRASRPEFDRDGAREASWRKDLYTALYGIVKSCTGMTREVHWVILHNA